MRFRDVYTHTQAYMEQAVKAPSLSDTKGWTGVPVPNRPPIGPPPFGQMLGKCKCIKCTWQEIFKMVNIALYLAD